MLILKNGEYSIALKKTMVTYNPRGVEFKIKIEVLISGH